VCLSLSRLEYRVCCCVMRVEEEERLDTSLAP
jgi:hypothetical protein